MFSSVDGSSIFQMIQNIQILNLYDTIHSNTLTTSLNWINLQSKYIPSLPYRNLLQTQTKNEFIVARTMIIYILVGSIPLLLIHGYICHHYAIFKEGILFYPQFQLTISSVLFLPIAKNACTLLRASYPPDRIFGVGIICMIILPTIIYPIYFINKYMVYKKDICYTNKSWVVSNTHIAWWIHAHKSIYMHRVGWKTHVNPIFQLQPNTHTYKRYHIVREPWSHKRWIQLYIGPITMSKKFMIAMFLKALSLYRFHQILWCWIIASVFMVIHLSVPLYSSIYRHVPDTLASIAEVLFFIFSFVSFYTRSQWNLPKSICQWLMLAFAILPQIGQVANSLLTKCSQTRQDERFFAVALRSRDLRYKYANRWLWIVHGRPLRNWPKPPIPTKHCQIVLDDIPRSSA